MSLVRTINVCSLIALQAELTYLILLYDDHPSSILRLRIIEGEPQNTNLRTNQISQKKLLIGLTGVLPAARDALSTIIRWLKAVHRVRLLSSTVICNGMQSA